MKKFLIFLLFAACTDLLWAQQVVFEVDAAKTAGANTRFWQAASPWRFGSSNSGAGLALMDRAKQYGTISYLRSHNSLGRGEDGTGGDVVRYRADGSHYFDFTIVNRTFDEYVKRGIKPVVEFDFFPEGWAKRLGGEPNSEGFNARTGEPLDWGEWEKLQRAFMQNLVDRYGVEEMRTWYYEIWNEPDSWPTKHLPVFFRLYDTFASVVKSFDGGFRVGGPGCFNMYFLYDFLEHAVNGKNYVTGQKGSPLDFVSYHLYGLSGAWLSAPPEIIPQVQRFTIELLWIERAFKKFKITGKVQFLLNEWGVCSNYERPVSQYPQLVYRNNEFSPLFMVKLVDCLWALEDNFGFRTDMMAYWGFCGEAARDEMFTGHRDLTTGGNIPKPIFTAYEMLARLGPERLAVKPLAVDGYFVQGVRYGVIPTRSADGLSLIAYNFCETDDNLTLVDPVGVRFSNLPAGAKYEWSEVLLDDRTNNSYAEWIACGSPADPSKMPASLRRKTAGLNVTARGSATVGPDGVLSLDIPLKRHSMKLLELKKK